MRALLTVAGALALSLSTSTSAQTTSDIATGQVFGNELGQVLNGWTHTSGGHHSMPRSKEVLCCYAIFRRSGEFAIAITEPVARQQTGAVIAERIIALTKVRPNPAEIETPCAPLWLSTALSLKNENTKMVRSWFYDGDGFQVLTWRDEDGSCDVD